MLSRHLSPCCRSAWTAKRNRPPRFFTSSCTAGDKPWTAKRSHPSGFFALSCPTLTTRMNDSKYVSDLPSAEIKVGLHTYWLVHHSSNRGDSSVTFPSWYIYSRRASGCQTYQVPIEAHRIFCPHFMPFSAACFPRSVPAPPPPPASAFPQGVPPPHNVVLVLLQQ